MVAYRMKRRRASQRCKRGTAVDSEGEVGFRETRSTTRDEVTLSLGPVLAEVMMSSGADLVLPTSSRSTISHVDLSSRFINPLHRVVRCIELNEIFTSIS